MSATAWPSEHVDTRVGRLVRVAVGEQFWRDGQSVEYSDMRDTNQ